MLVIAKMRGEYPLGIWRNPGEKFEFAGDKPALWMMTAEDVGKAKAEAKAKADEAAEILAAKAEAEEKVKAKAKNKKEDNKDDGAEDKDDKSDEAPKEIHAVHKGFGKWDVIGLGS